MKNFFDRLVTETPFEFQITINNNGIFLTVNIDSNVEFVITGIDGGETSNQMILDSTKFSSFKDMKKFIENHIRDWATIVLQEIAEHELQEKK